MSTSVAADLVAELANPLVPVRMLNEYAYCPRLAYLEWVQGQFTDNLETIEGRFGHRRVDRPSKREFGKATPSEPGDEVKEAPVLEAIHSRSLMLSAPIEGLIAKLDLVELDGPVATPVDYKRGKAPDVPEGAWEPERVQVCAQGLILREAGFQSDRGVIYFIGSRRRVEVVFDDALVSRTRQLMLELRRCAGDGRIPPPLLDSPKCPRCSLVGICLPDETNLLAAQAVSKLPGAGDELRRLIPSRDDALPLYVLEQGGYLGKSGDCLEVKKEGKVIQRARMIDVSQVSVFGNVSVTAQAMRELSARGIPMCHFSYGGWFHTLSSGLISKNVELRILQHQWAADESKALRAAKAFIAGKIKNCRTLLRRNLSEDPELSVDRLAEFAVRSQSAQSVAELMGVEGMAAKIYFAGFGRLLKGDEEFRLEGRNRRPPTDPVNAVLSFLYSMLAKELTVVLHAVGFDPMLGFLHSVRYGRPSLALDLAEEFRPLIADSTALTLINSGEIQSKEFLRRGGTVAMTDAGRKIVLGAFERRLDQEVTHPIFGYRISYRRVLEVQARLLGRLLHGEIPEYPIFTTR